MCICCCLSMHKIGIGCICQYAYGWPKLELVVYVTLRKCSRACEYFSPRYAYVGGQLVLSP